MASKGDIEREKKLGKTIAKYKEERINLKKTVKNKSLSFEERRTALLKLQSLPRDSSITRRTRRCILTGESHSVFRDFQLSRWSFRALALEGLLPGVKKVSW